jgi:hypothetical protein
MYGSLCSVSSVRQQHVTVWQRPICVGRAAGNRLSELVSLLSGRFALNWQSADPIGGTQFAGRPLPHSVGFAYI